MISIGVRWVMMNVGRAGLCRVLRDRVGGGPCRSIAPIGKFSHILLMVKEVANELNETLLVLYH